MDGAFSAAILALWILGSVAIVAALFTILGFVFKRQTTQVAAITPEPEVPSSDAETTPEVPEDQPTIFGDVQCFPLASQPEPLVIVPIEIPYEVPATVHIDAPAAPVAEDKPEPVAQGIRNRKSKRAKKAVAKRKAKKH